MIEPHYDIAASVTDGQALVEAEPDSFYRRAEIAFEDLATPV
jgi:hypothetical protein